MFTSKSFPFRTLYFLILSFLLLSGQDRAFSQIYNRVVGNDSLLLQQALCNVNNWSYWVYKDGTMGIAPGGKAGGIYPRHTDNVLYKDGLLWGARVNGEVILGGQEYRVGTQALLDRAYRVRIDWPLLRSTDFHQEAIMFFGQSNEAFEKRNLIKERYQNDWKNWPADKGAPYVDVDGNGRYNPVLNDAGYPDASRGDYPGIRGADEVIWLVVDDRDSLKMDNFYHNKPIGIREEITIWAYDQPDSALGQTVFKKFKITNISATVFKEMYLAQWADPDIGGYSDDFVGCDSLQNSCFAYNSVKDDPDFFNGYGISPAPAAGYVLLQGPVVASAGDTAMVDFKPLPGYKNLPMTGFFRTNLIHVINPDTNSAERRLMFYNGFRGNTYTPDIDNPTPRIHKAGMHKGARTRYALNGNPLTGNGDLDGMGDNDPAGDRVFCMVSGPFDLHPGESQEMVVAMLGGRGNASTPSMQVFSDNVKKIRQQFATLNERDHNDLQRIYAHLPRYIPQTMHLEQNYPNPFNPVTYITYGLNRSAMVELSVYSLTGQKVRTLVNGWQEAGNYKVDFNSSGLASGLYMYRLKSGAFAQTRKMIVLK